VPVFDQGYRKWHGERTGAGRRWWTIARSGCAVALKNKWVKFLVLAGIAPCLMFAIMLALWGFVEQQADWAVTFVRSATGLSEEVLPDLKALRNIVWTIAFGAFMAGQTFYVFALVLMVGPDLISRDLRFNAIPLYLSRPLRRIDYFLGKLGVIGLLVASVIVAPAVLAFTLGAAFSLDISVVRDEFHLLAGCVGYGLVVVFSAGLLMLAMSSLSRNSRICGAMWIGLLVITNGVGNGVYHATLEKNWLALSYPTLLGETCRYAINTERAYKDVVVLQEKIAENAKRASAFVGPFGGLLPRENAGKGGADRRRRPDPPAPPAEVTRRHRVRGDRFGDDGQPNWEAMVKPQLPPALTFGALAGIGLVSAWVLSTRISSLDRLK
jgi:ABC-2 type transport system permease protein